MDKLHSKEVKISTSRFLKQKKFAVFLRSKEVDTKNTPP